MLAQEVEWVTVRGQCVREKKYIKEIKWPGHGELTLLIHRIRARHQQKIIPTSGTAIRT
jgi:hypothetical protein